jgi:hypothetical protein
MQLRRAGEIHYTVTPAPGTISFKSTHPIHFQASALDRIVKHPAEGEGGPRQYEKQDGGALGYWRAAEPANEKGRVHGCFSA